MKEGSNIESMCEELCLIESVYLNPQKISKQQVKELLTKMKGHMFKDSKENLKHDDQIN